MPITMLREQRRTHEVGRIRIGVQVPVPNKPGKMMPTKLAVFRFTSRDEHAIRSVAELYGGEPRQWTGAPIDDQWEVITTAHEIGVTVPPGPQSVSQWMEMWSGGGCARRCDGEREQTRNVPCMCPQDQSERAELASRGQACKPTTRINLVLPDVPGLGVWRLESRGWNAAHELGGTAEFLAAIREAGAWVPAELRLEKRRVVSGGKTKEFVVPVLTLRDTMRNMLEGPRTTRIELPAPPPRALAIGAASPVVADPVDRSPKGFAVRAEECATMDALNTLGREAHGLGLMDEFVDSKYAPTAGEAIELVEVFRGRQAELAGVPS